MQQVMDQEDREMLLDEQLFASLEPADVLLRAVREGYTNLAGFQRNTVQFIAANQP